ncbi:MAG: hypothetical protein WC071_08810 [Victivallaceae bacterium]
MKKMLLLFVMAAMLPLIGAEKSVVPKLELNDLLARIDKSIDPDGKGKTVKTVVNNYEASVPMQQITMQMSTMFKAPDKIKTSMQIQGIPASTEAYNGKIGWSMMESLGVRQITGTQLEFMRLTARMSNPALRLQEIFAKIILADDSEKVGVVDCYKLICQAEQSFNLPPITIWIDRKTFFPAKMEMKVFTDMGAVPSTSNFADYKQYNGVFFPSVQTTTTLGMELTAKLLSVKFDQTIPDSEFDMPTQAAAPGGTTE